MIESLPDILSLNCQLENSKDVEFWKKQEEVQSVFVFMGVTKCVYGCDVSDLNVFSV